MCFSRSTGGRPVSSSRSLPWIVRPECVGELRVSSVDLRAVPPVRVVGDVGRGQIRVGGRVALRPLDLHRMLGPRIVVLELDLPRLLRLALAVAEPVVHLELDPGSGDQVERRRRLELVARQELTADQARVRIENRLRRFAFGVAERDVPAEAAALAAHQRVAEVVERAVDRARGRGSARRVGCGSSCGPRPVS